MTVHFRSLHNTASHLESVDLGFGLADYIGIQFFKIHGRRLGCTICVDL